MKVLFHEMKRGEKMNSKEIIKALNCMVGYTESTGDAYIDKTRLKNTYKLCDVAIYCIEKLCELQSSNPESRISDVADNTLSHIWCRLLD
jgi:hypothetical protein